MPCESFIYPRRGTTSSTTDQDLEQQRHRDPGLLFLLAYAAGRTVLFSSFRDRFGNGGGDTLIEDARDDVVLGQALLGDHGGDSFGGGQLHVFADPAGPNIQGAPEDSREAEDVVDL